MVLIIFDVKKIKLDGKKSIYGVYGFDFFFMTSVEAFYMSLDAILPLFNEWRRYIYQILLKKAFFDHEICYF
jgi:hypothetical protein